MKRWSYMNGVCCSGFYAQKGEVKFLMCLIQDRAIQPVWRRGIHGLRGVTVTATKDPPYHPCRHETGWVSQLVWTRLQRS